MPNLCANLINGPRARAALIALTLVAFCKTSKVNAESFTITLTPTEQTGAHGQYLSAPFDFGTAFAEIGSVRLEFVMPGGYQGTAVTTGNSSVFSSLSLLLHDAAIAVPDYWYNSTSSLGAAAFNVPAGAPTQIHFLYSASFPGDNSSLDWPDFMFTGRGQLALADEVHASHHPLPAGLPTSQSTAWLLPGEIQSAQLTIVGTPVPEPASIVLLIAGVFVLLSFRRFSRSRSTKSR